MYEKILKNTLPEPFQHSFDGKDPGNCLAKIGGTLNNGLPDTKKVTPREG